MALAIATNNAALNSAASASSVNRDMETSMARLSTGKRINSASDDAAGVAISSRLSAEIRGTDQAIRNSMDGQALIDTAEGAHKEVENILQRMREIAVQAANDTNNGQDRANLQAEMDAMSTEIDRIAGTTTWAGANLMEADTSSFSFQVGTATGTQNQINVDIKSMNAAALQVGDVGIAYTADPSVTTPSAGVVSSAINTTTTSYMREPAVHALADGGYLTTWGDPTNDQLFAQRFDSNGSAVGEEIAVMDTGMTGINNRHDVASLSDGGFIISFQAREAGAGASTSYFQKYNADGSKATPTVTNMDPETYSGNYGTVTGLAGGAFVTAWGHSGGGGVEEGQLYNSAAEQVGETFTINSPNSRTFGEQNRLLTLTNGDFVATWDAGKGLTGSDGNVYGRVYGADGTAKTDEFKITNYPADVIPSGSFDTEVAALKGGGFVATWEATGVPGGDTSSMGIYASIVSSDGVVGSPVLVNDLTDGFQGNPDVAALADGGFLIAFKDGGTVKGQRFDSTGSKLGTNFDVGNGSNASVAGLLDGSAVITFDTGGELFSSVISTGITAKSVGVMVTDPASSRSSITAIDGAIKTVNIQRSQLGAVSNRLNHTINNLTNISSNLSAAKGGIEDADFALETTNLAKNQILQQASTAMLAQANASKQNVLSLLQ